MLFRVALSCDVLIVICILDMEVGMSFCSLITLAGMLRKIILCSFLRLEYVHKYVYTLRVYVIPYCKCVLYAYVCM